MDKDCIKPEKNTEETKTEALEDLVVWAIQQGYYNAEESAQELSNISGKVLKMEQPYYNLYKWKDSS